VPQIMDTPGVPDKFKPKMRALTDHIGRGTRPNVDVEPARRLFMERRDVDFNDNLLDLLPKTGKVKRTPVRGRGQVPQAWDEEGYRYHFSPEENFEGIRGRGFDPDLKKGFSKGTHFLPTPDYPAIEDRPGNYYRVRQDVAPFKNVATDDFYTEQRIAPRDIEVYTGTPAMPTRWTPVSNAYSFGSGAKGLYDLLSSFMPGVLPQIQTPADWIIQDLMRNSNASPWNPKNQPGYTVPA
jgi:hypothetical protein